MIDELNSPEARAELEADEVRLWVCLQETGLWCPTCLLPSGYTFSIESDPAGQQSGPWSWACADNKTHRLETP